MPTPQEIKSWIGDLGKEKGFTPEQIDLVQKVAAGEVETLTKEQIALVTPLLTLTVGRHGEWQKAMNEANAAKQKADTHYQQMTDWRNKEVLPKLQAAEAKVRQFEDKYGPIDETEDLGGGRTRTASGDIVDTKDVKKVVDIDTAVNNVRAQMSQEFMQYEIAKNRLTQEHWSRFGKLLDTQPLLQKIAEHNRTNPDNQIGLDQAYQLVHGEDVKKYEDKKEADKIAAAEKRGEERAAKKYATAGGPRTGAAVGENEGAFWADQHGVKKEGEEDVSKLTDADRAAAFGQDYVAALEGTGTETS